MRVFLGDEFSIRYYHGTVYPVDIAEELIEFGFKLRDGVKFEESKISDLLFNEKTMSSCKIKADDEKEKVYLEIEYNL